MKDTQWTIYKQIIPPMMAMMILTLLIGAMVYQVTFTWQREMNTLAQKLSETVIANNIHINLLQAKATLQSDPKEAKKLLQSVKEQVLLLRSQQPAIYERTQLASILEPETGQPRLEMLENLETLEKIDQVLNHNVVSTDLMEGQENLRELQHYTSTVTYGVMLSMLCLGLVLMAITALDLSRLFRNLAESRDLNIVVQEEERRRIAQDLHDGIIQGLIDMKRSYTPEKVDELVENIRRICHNLKPQVLEDIGLGAALEFLSDDLREKGKRRVNLLIDEGSLQYISKEYELTLFRVIQELFNNIKRHANATTITLTFLYAPEESRFLQIHLKYNGESFDPKKVRKGMGLSGVAERIRRLGGEVKLQSNPEQGTYYQLFIPVERRRTPRTSDTPETISTET